MKKNYNIKFFYYCLLLILILLKQNVFIWICKNSLQVLLINVFCQHGIDKAGLIMVLIQELTANYSTTLDKWY